MELLNQTEVEAIVKKCGYMQINNLKWRCDDYSNELIGYLGEHLRLVVEVKTNEVTVELHLFLKCMPRFDQWKATYIKETNFFRKEHAMLNGLFQNFQDNQGERKWRPKVLHTKEELFVFEDVTELGYEMPNHMYTLSDEQLRAAVVSLARFHAQSYIYEETKTRELDRPYRIWEDYGEYLTEPTNGQSWRDTGERAAMDFLKKYSSYKFMPDFCRNVDTIMPTLFDSALKLMQPSSRYRNVVVHRDIWTNNVFLKKLNSGKFHALLVDFQTVLYCSPMLDLSSLLFFNTTKNFRRTETDNIIDLYYTVLEQESKLNSLDIRRIIDKDNLKTAYAESIIFGITQAALIVPFISINGEKRKEIFDNKENALKVYCISRSEEFLETASVDENYRDRVIELLDDIVERFICPLVI